MCADWVLDELMSFEGAFVRRRRVIGVLRVLQGYAGSRRAARLLISCVAVGGSTNTAASGIADHFFH